MIARPGRGGVEPSAVRESRAPYVMALIVNTKPRSCQRDNDSASTIQPTDAW